ncbi:MAG: M1 family aminopeptidase [Symbiobacteriia bacterium]
MLRVTQYDLKVRLDFEPDFLPPSAPGRLHVDADLRVENTGAEPVDTMGLCLYRLHTVADVRVDGRPAGVRSSLTGLNGLDRHHVNAVTIDLPRVLAKGDTCTVSLGYGGVTAGAREVWQYLWDSVSRDYTLLRPDMLWYPLAAAPDVNSLRRADTELKHFRVDVDVPGGYTAIGPEPLGREGRRASFRTTAPRARFDLAVARFSHLTSGEVTIYHTPECEQWAERALQWVDMTRRELTYRLGGRPTGTLAIVQIPKGWGSQNTPGLILQEPGDPADWRSAAQILHEVSHFWTPAPGDWPNRFADESLASFLQYFLLGQVFDQATAEQLADFERTVQSVPGATATSFLAENMPDECHGTVWYAKGALALQDLREQLGEEAFWAVLREYTAASQASVAGFVELLNHRHPGTETTAYLRRWFQ